jgi:phospholipid-translocating ATPase
MKSTTSATPLVAKSKRQNISWFDRYLTQPLAKLSPANLLSRRRAPAPARSIYINDPLPGDFFDNKGHLLKTRRYDSNQNVTSKYTILTFLPRNLLEQFRRIANIFFLAIAILQFFPKFSTISPGLVILPLIAVLAITAGKDGYEDIKRHQADHKVNHSIVHTLVGPGYENTNPMENKTKTFIPAIPLPKLKSKKSKMKGEIADGAKALGRTEGNVQEGARTALPGGEDGQGGLDRVRSQVSNWEDDPEAGDSAKELGWQRTIWEDVKVGDIVKIYENEQFPAGTSSD